MQHRRERALQLTSPPSSSSASSSLIAASALGQPAMSLSSHSYPAPGQLATSSKPGGARIAPSSPPRRIPQQQPEQQQPHHNQPHHGPQDNPSWVALVSCVGTVWWCSAAATAHRLLSSQAVLRVPKWPLCSSSSSRRGGGLPWLPQASQTFTSRPDSYRGSLLLGMQPPAGGLQQHTQGLP
jgi:hypothetical protein